MRPQSHWIHVCQVEYPHVAVRQRVHVEQPVPHHFVTFQLTVWTKQFRVCRRHSVTQHSVQVWREFRQREHVTVDNSKEKKMKKIFVQKLFRLHLIVRTISGRKSRKHNKLGGPANDKWKTNVVVNAPACNYVM